MKQKIEWYQEVLELEPGSKVFFPLAKLLAEDGQIAEAILTLRQGSLRHPDHIEARLFLIELLSAQGASSDMQVEVDQLGSLLGAYPSFWNAWEGRLARNPSTRDAALALRFFVAVLQGASLNWASVIDNGLKATLASSAAPGTLSAAPPPTAEAAVLSPQSAVAAPDHAPSADAVAKPNAPDAAPQDVWLALDEEEGDEVFSLRTRSMAEVLAEQGDIAGALDIYNELLRDASAEEKPGLRERADALAGRIQQVFPQSAVPDESAAASNESAIASGEESNRLVNLLESLAQRLEARAQ